MKLIDFLISAKTTMNSFTKYFTFRPFAFLKNICSFANDFCNFQKNKTSNNFSLKQFYPCLDDKTKQTPLSPIYFLQNTWAAEKIFKIKPEKHYDIGSQAMFVGIISQFVPTTMVDIRPLPVKLSNLHFIKGDIKKLPFKNNSLKSVSCLCVIEHIGLGRYGDEIDVKGSEKAISELIRVLQTNGSLLVSVPVYKSNVTYFNAHRAFTRDYILEVFSELSLVGEKYIYDGRIKNNFSKNFGTGLYHFNKK
jgi:SAM-dependent methyltransferase